MNYAMQQMMIPEGPTPYMMQTCRLSPPISLSLEDITQNAKNLAKPKKDEYICDAIKVLIESETREQPYTDLQICGQLNSQGYSLTKQDVAIARESLGIKSSYERTQ